MKVTDPVGTLLPEADAETVEVNVTLWPKVVGFVEEARATEVPPMTSMLVPICCRENRCRHRCKRP